MTQTLNHHSSSVVALLTNLGRLCKTLKIPEKALASAADAFLQADPKPLRSMNVVPIGLSRDQLQYIALTTLGELVDTLNHNVSLTHHQSAFMQRSVYSNRIPERAVSDARALIRSKAEAFTEALDDELSELETNAPAPTEPTRRLGVGVFYFESVPKSNADSVEALDVSEPAAFGETHGAASRYDEVI